MAKKFTDYINEAYKMDEYEDIATEHAKYVIALYIDNLSDGMTMQQALDQMFKELSAKLREIVGGLPDEKSKIKTDKEVAKLTTAIASKTKSDSKCR